MSGFLCLLILQALVVRLLWRGSLLPLGCEAVAAFWNPKGIRVASQPSGSKLPRHKSTPRSSGSGTQRRHDLLQGR
ncbi:hypothetical protein CEQ51_10440 [Pseudomonas thivervalensis]|uniref:Uncharacterized protein n=1 Tax=Pseudomonas thivervalensis TaxID=86265 RepID=A0A2Z4ZSD1_9PSED|nr:hypothetical protein CE140_10600 [Pseudomonas thivervalensis]AXA60466.1 hypothetical protein CEQ51_10440 [Pseudomonas thivervalensis]